jgi:hypothetical protein
VLQYLVSSKARRRLLVILWKDGQQGSVAELAKRAGVAFGQAHAELREMQLQQIVRSARVDGREVFWANESHPEAGTLRALVAAEVPRPSPPTADDDRTRSQLVSLGAPLSGVRMVEVEPDERVAALARGVQLTRRDPVVARALPLAVWNLRDSVNARALEDLLHLPAEHHAAGFFLELTGELGGDRRLVGVAESLRDRRMTSVQPFFQLPTTKRNVTRPFPLAEKWGFEMNVDLDSFRTLFDKFVR